MNRVTGVPIKVTGESVLYNIRFKFFTQVTILSFIHDPETESSDGWHVYLLGENVVGVDPHAGGEGDEVGDRLHDVPGVNPPCEPGQSSTLHREQSQASPESTRRPVLSSHDKMSLHLKHTQISFITGVQTNNVLQTRHETLAITITACMKHLSCTRYLMAL